MNRILLILLLVLGGIGAWALLRPDAADDPTHDPGTPIAPSANDAEPSSEPTIAAPDEVSDPAADPAPELPVVAAVEPGEASFSGRVLMTGELPELPALKITDDDPNCCPDATLDATNRNLLVDGAGGVANAVVELSIPGAQAKPTVASIEKIQCRFEPHVVAVGAGSTIQYYNGDSQELRLETMNRRNPRLQEVLLSGGSTVQDLPRPEFFKVRNTNCKWMRAWVYVARTPHFAMTDENGRFRIEGLPPGEYTVNVWHETLGRQLDQLVIEEGENTHDFEMEASTPATRRAKDATKGKSEDR